MMSPLQQTVWNFADTFAAAQFEIGAMLKPNIGARQTPRLDSARRKYCGNGRHHEREKRTITKETRHNKIKF
jgi:hypothetical protein